MRFLVRLLLVLLVAAAPLLATGGACHPTTVDPEKMEPGFERARAAFTLYAAEQLGLKPSELELVIPVREDRAGDFRIGSIWAFSASIPPPETPGSRPYVRAWADAEGRVLTLERDLERILTEAGVFADPPPTAEAIARHLLYPKEQERFLLKRYEYGSEPPRLERGEDGTLDLVFYAEIVVPGPGPAPIRVERYHLRATPGGPATLEVTPWTPQLP